MLPKTKITRVEYKEPLASITKRILGSKLTVAAVVLIVVGVSLVEISYNYHETFSTPSKSSYVKAIDTNTTNTFSFVQPKNYAEHVYFTLPNSFNVSYKLVKYVQYTSVFGDKVVKKYSVSQTGNATNNTIITIPALQQGTSQEYLLNLTSHSSSTFTVHVLAQYNITVTKDSAINLGLPGLIIAIAGVIMLAYSVTMGFESRKKR